MAARRAWCMARLRGAPSSTEAGRTNASHQLRNAITSCICTSDSIRMRRGTARLKRESFMSRDRKRQKQKYMRARLRARLRSSSNWRSARKCTSRNWCSTRSGAWSLNVLSNGTYCVRAMMAASTLANVGGSLHGMKSL